MQTHGLGKTPSYLAPADTSLANMLNSLFLTKTITASEREDYRQMTICIHEIIFDQILSSLWNAYLKSGLGTLKSQLSHGQFCPRQWPVPVKSMVKVDIREGTKENDACLSYVKNRLIALERLIEQSQANLHHRSKTLPDYTPMIKQKIETFVDEKLVRLRRKIEHKIQLVHYDYDECILQQQYLQHNPTEAQVRSEACTYVLCNLFLQVDTIGQSALSHSTTTRKCSV